MNAGHEITLHTGKSFLLGNEELWCLPYPEAWKTKYPLDISTEVDEGLTNPEVGAT